MSHVRSMLIAAVAVTAALTSACAAPAEQATTVEKTTVSLGRGDTSVTAAVGAPAELGVSASPEWTSLPGRAVPVTGSFAPGVPLRGLNTEGKLADCTVGIPLRDGRFLTAGHCGVAGSPHSLVNDSGDQFPGSAVIEDSVVDRTPGTPMIDAAVVTVPAGTVATARIAGLPISRVMSRDAVRDLPRDTPVCVAGAVSGIACGTRGVAAHSGMKLDLETRLGDSGGPVFLVDAKTQSVTLIGMISKIDAAAGDSGDSIVTYLEPTLQRLGEQALVDSPS